ncbi:transposase domain-containing protein [Nocardiopsis sp. YSL2]|uniref:transposase domain-containing protein n=1 Tax=Nocardiopsis sp. YSL2 TaxID=2939492 RepID=UPI00350E4A04
MQPRLRRIPSRVVVYLLLAGALFTGLGWKAVWSRLTASLPHRSLRPRVHRSRPRCDGSAPNHSKNSSTSSKAPQR